MPRHIAAFRIDRYRVGMAYGNHLDNPLIGDSETLRSDISMTVFLSDPASYDGGELRLETPFRRRGGEAVSGRCRGLRDRGPARGGGDRPRGAGRGHRLAAELPCATRPSAKSSTR